jgi:curli biogenesis system outer membrane secretion channel CsgG
MLKMQSTKPLLVCLALGLAGCASLPSEQLATGEDPVVTGAAARRNYTPLESAFGCLANTLREKKQPVVAIAVGDVKDYTGKYNQNEGSAITQGGALMVYSALGKLGNVVQIQERFDTRIAELELAYTDRRQLGDGRSHPVEEGKPAVPWVPYFGGSILRSQYYIIGGITEVNYDIHSGGFDGAISNVGAKRRTYTMNVGVDLRIIDTRTLVVAKTVSLQKQIKGEEVGAGVYRFFGTELLDLTVGAKNQEPLQLGVRTTIEQSVLELIAAVYGVDANDCVNQALDARRVAREGQPVPPEAVAPVMPPPVQVPVKSNGNGQAGELIDPESTQSGGLVPQNAGAVGQGAAFELEFEFASAAVSAQAMSQIAKMANDASQGKSLSYKVLGRDNEVLAPLQRRDLTNQRIRAISDLLVARGVQASRISVNWRPEPTDASITHYGSGLQLLATMSISK